MSKILYALGLLQILGGVLVAFSAKSAIHEILGSISFGMGVLAVGLAAIISRISDLDYSAGKQIELMRDIKDGRTI